MAGYFLSMNPLVRLEKNLPNLAAIEDADTKALIAGAAGVVIPRGVSPRRYFQITRLARNWFPNLDLKFCCRGKTAQTRLFQQLRVRHPRSVIYASARHLLAEVDSGLPFPLVVKGDSGGGGVAVFPAHSREELVQAAGRLPPDEPVLVQERVVHGGMDLRVVVMGRVMASYFRVNRRGFYTNICRGGRIGADLWPEGQRRGLEAVAAFCRRTGVDFAGFDLMLADDGPPIFIEINFNFGRKGIGGTPGFRRMFQEAVSWWCRGHRLPEPQALRPWPV